MKAIQKIIYAGFAVAALASASLPVFSVAAVRPAAPQIQDSLRR